jgi:uncharacterized iron-regulated protein
MLPLAAAALFLSALQPSLQAPAATPSPSAYVPQRVYDTRQKAFADFESMLADLTRADVVFVGEQHDDANTHRLELAILEGLLRRQVPVVVAMEMFERDVQPQLDRYLAGTITEEAFLASARPWPRYATDYRPIIEFARAHHLPVLASDVPRRIASDVAKSGLDAVDGLGSDRSLAAKDLPCPPSGGYYDRFLEAMGGHPASGEPQPADVAARNNRFYFAQCVKDETMGESIANALETKPAGRATIVHFNGAFHSDYAQGTAAAASRRLPGRRIAVVSILPVEDLDHQQPNEDQARLADYLVYTLQSAARK